MKTSNEKYITYETTIIKRDENKKPKDVIVNASGDEISVSIRKGYKITNRNIIDITQSMLDKLDKQEKIKNDNDC